MAKNWFGDSEESQFPIRQTGEPSRRLRYPSHLGFSDQPWYEIASRPLERRGVAMGVEFGRNVLQGGTELMSEGAHAIGETARMIWQGAEGVTDAVHDSPFATHVRQNILGTEVAERAAPMTDVTKGLIDSAMNIGKEEPGAIDPAPLFSEAAQLADERTQLDTLMEDPMLTDTSRFALQQARERNAENMANLELQLIRAQQQLDLNDTVYSFDAAELGLDLDLEPLSEAIKSEGGVGKQTMLAIASIADMASLSMEEKQEAVGQVMNRADISHEIIEEIDGMMFNLEAVKKLDKMSDEQLLTHLGDPARFFTPPLEHVGELDPDNRNAAILDKTVLNSWPSMFDSLDDERADDITNAYLTLINDPENEQALASIAAIAELAGEDPALMEKVVKDAVRAAHKDQEAFDNAKTMEYGTPGEIEYVYAVMHAGRDMELPDDQLMLLANSTELHAIIDVMSDGKPGQTHGNVAGLGGLSKDLYPRLMSEVGEPGDGGEWSADRGLQWELQALLAYIWREFNGDPIAAYRFFHNTGMWGGTSAMEATDRPQSKPQSEG